MKTDRPDTTRRARWVRRVKLNDVLDPDRHGVPSDGSPWVCDWRSYDIPETIEAGIRQAALGMTAVSLCMLGGPKMIFAAERAAHERGVRVLWWFGPNVNNLSEQAKATMRGWVREAKAAVS